MSHCVFKYACLNDHLKVVKLLVYIDPSVVNSFGSEYVLRLALAKGHLDVVRWLVEMYAVNICPNNGDYNFAFKHACFNNHLEVAKWLVNSYPQINVYHDNNNIFRYVCYWGHLEVAKWLVESFPSAVNVSACNNSAFKNACTRNCVEVAKWLVEIQPYHYMLELDQYHTQILSWRIRPIQETRWLERAVPILAYNSKTANMFQKLNYDMIRYICEFV